MPDGNKLSICNVYLPPMNSLSRRGIAEEEARTQVTDILEQIPPQDIAFAVGDFNTRVGNLAP